MLSIILNTHYRYNFPKIFRPAHGNLPWIQNLSKQYDSTFRLWVGTRLHVVVTKVEDIETVLSSPDCINRADLAKATLLDAIGAESIFTLEDDQWKKIRRIIGPSFNHNVVIKYLPIFNKQSMYCADELRKHVGGATFDIRPIVEEATVFSFVQATLARDISPQDMRKYAETVSK